MKLQHPPNGHRLKEELATAVARAEAAERRVAELEAQLAAQAWRPVSDPPGEDGDYLAFLWSGECEVLSFNDGYWSYVPVTHWRPLPAPPIN